MTNAITVRNVKKTFRMRGMGAPTLFGALKKTFLFKNDKRFEALKDVTFDIKQGSTVGVIGPNGSGKSSLLGLIAGTMRPTEGEIQAHGRVSCLLELGAGFHPDLTGRENVFLNAAILGIRREDIRKRMDHIIGFSELDEYIDMPVKHYSSGMYVRLGFAVAVEVDPDILLIDEVLAVGDISFQLKCMDRIREFQRHGKTIMFVSHALQTVDEFCDEALLIHEGRLADKGAPPDVILTYIKSYMGEGGGLYTQEYGTRDVEIVDAKLVDNAGKEAGTFPSGEPLHIEIRYRARKQISKPVFGFSLKTGNGFYIYGSNTQLANFPIEAIEGEGTLRLTLPDLPLMQGNYFLSLSIHSWDHETQYHRREDWYPFAVRRSELVKGEGVFYLPAEWQATTPTG